MTKVGMLYICTGKYTVFWPEFYRTFNEKFLPNCEKEYFVFTDAPAIEYEDAPGVHRIYQEPYPWPYSTLKRFSIFLTQETVLSKMDYLFFFNANLTCTQTITEEEFLPRPARGEADLQQNVIALWHDESQLNRYAAERSDYRLLTPAYWYPEGWQMPFEQKITVRDKSRYFDVAAVKNKQAKPQSRLQRKWGAFCENYLPYWYCLRDTLLHKTLKGGGA